MKLYFKKPHRACGYSLQMEIDTDNKAAKIGYFLTISPCLSLSARDFDDLAQSLRIGGFTVSRE